MNDRGKALLAHSARAKRGIPTQSYWEHALNTSALAEAFARRAAGFWNGPHESFARELALAGLLHDCGKLDPENQAVLGESETARLPVPHEEAGVAWLLRVRHLYGAMLVAGHHAGLPSMPGEIAKVHSSPPGNPFRRTDLIARTDSALEDFEKAYAENGVTLGASPACAPLRGPAARIALSCLVDADHSDTARHYGGEAVSTESLDAPRRWSERLASLDRHVASLPSVGGRASMRARLYRECREAAVTPAMRSCDAAVGTGKTTAVMAHLLRVAAARDLRRIFVVLPFTNIIRQSVEVYRQSLVLEGEDPEQVVAELHHLADFEDPDNRALAALWRAPIVVTTAVQFFETIAAARTGALRKLHELPGSAVFVDEAHAAIPPKLWPGAWGWLEQLADDWGCHFVFGSGSLVRFWRLPLIESRREVPDLVGGDLREHIELAERQRVTVSSRPEALTFDAVIDLVESLPGPRLAIFNTVQNAAVVADRLAAIRGDRGQRFLFHLSSALTPSDRARVLDRIRGTLPSPDVTVVATSCIEAGVDLSFRSGAREACGLASLVQTGGRVNRHAGHAPGASALVSFAIADPLATVNRTFDDSRRVLAEMLAERFLDTHSLAESMTEALRRQLVLRSVHEYVERLSGAEVREDYPAVAELFKVIEGDTRVVIVDPLLVSRLELFDAAVKMREVLAGSVQLWARRIDRLGLQPLTSRPSMFRWNREYERDFLGYMRGILADPARVNAGLEMP